MHVVEHGTGTPLFLLHGFGVDHRLLLPLDPVVDTAGGWRRIYLDLPGMGRTPVGDVDSAEAVVAVVEDEIRRRAGTEPFAVLGNSFGAMIARRVAHDIRPQVLGLAALAGVFVADHDERSVPPRTVLAEDREVVAELGEAAEAYADITVVQNAATARAFVEHAYPGLRDADQGALDRIARDYALEQEPEDAHPEPFTQPTLFVAGRQDHVVGYRDAWTRVEHYPRATFAVLDAAGHNVHQEQATVTAALLTDWLHRIRAART